MARDVSLQVNLDSSLSNIVIEKILRKALQLNVKMYAYTYEDIFNTSRITIEEAMHRIENKEDEAPVRCQFEDTGFFLYFTELQDGKCNVGLGTTNFPWKKEFCRGENMTEFDLSRYIRLLLALVQGLKINKIEAYVYWV